MGVGGGCFAADSFIALVELSIPINSTLPASHRFWGIDKESRFFGSSHLNLRVKRKVEVQACGTRFCSSDNNKVGELSL